MPAGLVSPDQIPTAHERVTIAPEPPWAASPAYNSSFPARGGEAATPLLLVQQRHAELHQTYYSSVVRLETIEGVHQHSQWRINFDPQTQAVVVHRLCVRRGDMSSDQCEPERLRVLQREEGLERLVVDGSFTLLAVLDDVRIGDIIECAFTVQTEHQLLPACEGAFFTLPLCPVGKYHFALRFAQARPMRWKSPAPAWKPDETVVGAENIWAWTGENYVPARPEQNPPPWYNPNPWVQFSDCPDWQAVSAALAEAWEQSASEDAEAVEELASAIEGAETDLLKRIQRAIEAVQDEHRYLSVNWDHSGRVPAAPGRVARRRYGDCKDLSWLLVTLLRRLGVKARPVLVNTRLRDRVKDLLPDLLFDHAIAEFEVNGERRWIEATAKRQGGTALNRAIADYRTGLAIEREGGGLVAAPRSTAKAGLHEVKESLLLDTTGAASILALKITGTGLHGDMLRNKFASTGGEELENEFLQMCRMRFGAAEKAGPLDFRDDRDQNIFVIAQVYEVNGFLHPGESRDVFLFPYPASPALNLLPVPEKSAGNTPRRAPFALPHPCNLAHVVEVESPALQPMSQKGVTIKSPSVQFTRTHKSLYRQWMVTFKCSTLVDHVAGEKIADYRQAVEAIWRDSMVDLRVAAGYAHPKRRDDFGRLPSVRPRSVVHPAPQSQPQQAPPQIALPQPALRVAAADPAAAAAREATTAAAPAAAVKPVAIPPTGRSAASVHNRSKRSRRSRRSSRRKGGSRASTWVAIAAVAAVALYCGKALFFSIRSGMDRREYQAEKAAADSAHNGGQDFNMPQRAFDEATALLNKTGAGRDVTAASNHLERAIAAGHAPSAVLMGELLLKGDVLPQDLERAYLLFKTAADSGDAGGQMALGEVFENGAGRPRDLVEACKWYQLAAPDRPQEAAARLARVQSQMTPEQVAEARRRAAAFERRPKV